MIGPPERRNPRPGEGAGASAENCTGSKQNPKYKTTHRVRKVRPRRRQTKFARAAVFEMFGYRHGRAIDYDRFIDRKPSQPPRPSPEVWHMANGRAST